jgi:hypothetical protein
MQSPADVSRRTPLALTTSGLAKMMEAIKQQASEVHAALDRHNGYALFSVTTASGMALGFQRIGGVSGAAIGTIPAYAMAGAAAAVIGVGAIAKMMRANQESTRTAVAEARENVQQRLQQADNGAGSSPRPS